MSLVFADQMRAVEFPLVAMMLHPECFETSIPKIIGDDYVDYLNYSKDLSLNDRG